MQPDLSCLLLTDAQSIVERLLSWRHAGAPKISLESRYGDVQKVKGGTRMKLEVTVTGCPTPTVSWQLDDRPLTGSAGVSVRTDRETGLSTVDVDEASRLTAGRYRVTAENDLGRATAHIDVAVTGQFPSICNDNLYRKITDIYWYCC